MKIVIVGGGTAGWLAGYILNNHHGHDVVVIESSKIGIIGVGEGGTHIFGSLINGEKSFGFDLKDFMDSTEATIKLGIKHKNWPNTYYLPLDLLQNSDATDYLPLVSKTNLLKVSDLGMFLDQHRLPFTKDETDTWKNKGYSFHFDGNKVGLYFKNHCKNVTSVDAVVRKVNIDHHGNISGLSLDNEQVITGDLYIDCTGFQRVLMNALGNKWISYSKHLLMNSAIPFRMPVLFDENNRPIVEAVTQSEAYNAGWTWTIPLRDKIGHGYVFCDQFIDYNKAIQEIENRFKKEIDPVKHIKFDPGRLENLWLNNCVSLGLASAFVEPLEATSIHATLIQIEELASHLYNTDSNNNYNEKLGKLYDDIKDFIVLHYMGGRNDTEFWRYCSNTDIATPKVKEILEIAQYRLLTPDDIPNPYNSLSYRAWNQVLMGLKKFSNSAIEKSITHEKIDSYEKWKTNLLKELENYRTLNEVLDYIMESVKKNQPDFTDLIIPENKLKF